MPVPRTPSGNQWMMAGEKWLADRVWPHVGRQRQPHMGDFTGTWDLNVEATIVPWSKIWVKLRQSEGDARNRGLDLACVWKKHNRSEDHRGPLPVDPGEGAVIMYAWQFFPLVARLEKLEAASLDAEDQYTRGFTAGMEYAKRFIPGATEAEEVAR